MDPLVMVFFTLKDLEVGNSMSIYFRKKDSSTSPLFLPRDEAKAIPFSLTELPNFLRFFSFSQDSPQAKAMEATLRECETPAIKGEIKFCATSIASMLDFTISSRELFTIVKYWELSVKEAMATKFDIEKFNERNFSLWKLKMNAILRKDGCLAAISERPVDFTDNNKWIEMDGNTMPNFHLALADELIINLTNSNVTSLVFDDVTAAVLQEENQRKNKEDRQVFHGVLLVMKGEKIAANLYMLKGETFLEVEASIASCSSDSAMLWHQKLGHMSEQGMKVLVEQKLLPGLTNVSLTLCDHCITSKQHWLKFNTSNSRGKSVLELVYSDVWQAPVTSLGGAKYFVLFIDDYSRRCWVYPIKKKSDVFSNFKNFKARVELDSENKIKCFRTNNRGEHSSEEFDDFFRKEGIKRQFTVANNPQQNGVEFEKGDSSKAEPVHDEQEPESSETPTTRQSDRVRRRPNWHLDYVIEGNIAYCILTEDGEPLTYQKAINNSDASLWMMEMQEEIEAIHKNNAWDLVPLPQGRKPIGSKCVFKIKRNGDDQVERYRARLVVKGYDQKECIDLNKIFSPAVRVTTVRVVLAMCATLNLHLEQLDVKTVFLHGNLEEEIYMLQPEGFEEKEKKNLVSRLNKSLYSLKQEPRYWYKRFDSFVMFLGYNRLNADPCAYLKRFDDNDFSILLLYVDDMLVVGPNNDHIEELKAQLAREFEMKDLRSTNNILGMQIHRDRSNRKIWLSQKNYLKKILSRFNMQDCKPIYTSLPINFKLSSSMSPSSEEERIEMSRVPYALAVRSLMFAMICTRPDIAQAVGVLVVATSTTEAEYVAVVKFFYRCPCCIPHSIIRLNSDIKIIATEHHTKSSTLFQNYTILKEPDEILASRMVACHTMPTLLLYCIAIPKGLKTQCSRYHWVVITEIGCSGRLSYGYFAMETRPCVVPCAGDRARNARCLPFLPGRQFYSGPALLNL
ncbi:hypothetical protein F3Y22_tig00110831pilonHSYRG00315 [Hibiscus syriacus]|uniref:Integrase catalytic domain-containing protein n=1 Tax=Hibiscus syriacus TaxID=106335 RepID=A0A6A2ZKS1_HIBSY|nr:hypothetical protein F3Y22_tig00110831pilonHSYRG00315 [Hibiscus syriacus]